MNNIMEITEERKKAVNDAVFKIYCSLMAAGFEKEKIKQIAIEVLKQYGIDFKDI